MTACTHFEGALAAIRGAPDSNDWPSPQDVRSTCGHEAVKQCFDELAVILAERYQAGSITFEEGDHLANGWWAQMIARHHEGWSDLLHEVYEAFDAGEWSHSGEWFSHQPVKDYTDPAIAKILNRHRSA